MKISEMTALTVTPASGDLIPIVDVSDTTQAASGTTKKIAASVLGLDVKRYVALLTQSGTDAPVATVLENSLGGTVVWAYVSAGIYTATLASAYAANKTIVSPNGRDTATNMPLTMDGYYVSTSVVRLVTFEQDDWTASITIGVYP